MLAPVLAAAAVAAAGVCYFISGDLLLPLVLVWAALLLWGAGYLTEARVSMVPWIVVLSVLLIQFLDIAKHLLWPFPGSAASSSHSTLSVVDLLLFCLLAAGFVVSGEL